MRKAFKWLEGFYYALVRNYRETLYSIRYGFVNLYKWFPIIWRDRDWDFAFVFPILEKKFEDLERAFQKDSIHCKEPSAIKRLKTCKELCRRLKDDWYYHENTFMFHDRKYGEIKMELNHNNVVLFSRERAITDADKKMEHNQSLFLYKRSQYRMDYDLELLLRYIEKYHNKWWI